MRVVRGKMLCATVHRQWAAKMKMWQTEADRGHCLPGERVRKPAQSHAVHEAFPGEIALFFLRHLMLGAFDTKQAVAKGRIHQVAMMWAFLIIMRMGREEPAGDAHFGDRNVALLLKRPDHLDQRAEQRLLFGWRKYLGRRRQEIRPSRGHIGFATSLRAQADHHRSRVGPGSLFFDQTTLLQYTEHFGSRGKGHGQFFADLWYGSCALRPHT